MASISENDVRNVLGEITDPDLGKSLEELNAIDQINIKDNLIEVSLKLTQPIQWVAEQVNNLCADKLNEIAPDMESEISISEQPFQYHTGEFLKDVKNIIAVASGKGGVGKSAIAANIAAALSLQGAKVGILDSDVYGPSQPTMYGLEGEQLVAVETEEGKPKAHPLEKYGIKVASMGFIMNRDQAAIIRGPMLAGYFSMLFEQVDWGALDFLIFDLPPGTGDVQLTLTQKIPLTGAVVVTTPQEIALADVRRAIAMFNRVNVKVLGVVENMSYFIPPDMPDKRYPIFGEGGGRKIAMESGVKLLGEVPFSIDMREGNDNGAPYVLDENSGEQGKVLKEAAERVVKEVRIVNANAGEQQVDISI